MFKRLFGGLFSGGKNAGAAAPEQSGAHFTLKLHHVSREPVAAVHMECYAGDKKLGWRMALRGDGEPLTRGDTVDVEFYESDFAGCAPDAFAVQLYAVEASGAEYPVAIGEGEGVAALTHYERVKGAKPVAPRLTVSARYGEAYELLIYGHAVDELSVQVFDVKAEDKEK